MAHSDDGSDCSGIYGIQPYVFDPEPDPEQEASAAEAVDRSGKVNVEGERFLSSSVRVDVPRD